ncbi:ferrous iron transport protein B [Schwartzia succinivorans]|jgi:ferrous iron transport protein B|uniref:Ferrous iron transport protein B n=1 Tax=Schwartzia succinivorans DSM 10502 TaxID=1123243 RepID=A0A1M4SVF7_9FIRM|nr:ferrous iron transport protein B [Schwartzia succinivorans]MBQ1917823.1 ferrous iron transport protein B [Schwartzia sp. (in: firmicutes)]SHE36190.1 ferrous iron transport protein B [Schwartzia succinivorans DSM 10502]
MSTLAVALTGNPNTGKSTIFNELTGARQKIGNWPGVTVDKKVGYVNHNDRAISIVDLPGTYSISARSPEEKIVIDYLMNNKLDLVMDVVDSSNLERNLFLTVQLLEQGVPLLIDLNMQDEASAHGIHVDMKKLEELLGMPVVETVGRSSKSTKKLLDVFTSTVMSQYHPSEILEEHIAKIKEIRQNAASADAAEEAVIEARYAFIDRIMSEAVTMDNAGLTKSEKIDKVLANGVLALPIFLAIMYGVFQITFEWIGQPLADALDGLINEDFIEFAKEALEGMGVADWMVSLVTDGIIAGVGAVLTFVPLIFVLFFCLSFLDGTGYMARIAFITDPIMRRCGLTGKGIMPLMMAHGCAVPAVMGARALDSEKDRLVSILVTPFLTCGAKLPIMALFAAMFFPDNAGDVVFGMYIIGVVMAIIAAKILGATTFKGEGSTFLLELPPYRMPDMKTVLLETWDKGKGYLIKAGTIIFAASVLLWVMSNYNFSGPCEIDESILATLGSWMSTLFVFHGFATWEAGAALLSGIMAKETVVATMGVLYGAADVSTEADEALEAAKTMLGTGMATSFTTLSAFAFMVFSQLYTPCVTALGTIKKETNSWKWMGFSAVYMFAIAWVVSLIVYQGGKLMGF